MMLETPLIQKHIDLGAKMAPFAGYNMPILYTGVKDEHQCVRERAGMFDVSHMGEFILKGDKAYDLIQRVVSNDISKLVKGQAMYACLPNDNGGIVDDLLVYYLEDGHYMLVVNAANIDKDWNWIQSKNTGGVEMHNISPKTALLAVQGPKAIDVIQKLTSVDLSKIDYYHFTKGVVAGFENVLISATGYTGAGGFELYCVNEQASGLWDAIMEAGKEYGLQPIGLAARDTLRLEMGFCLYGNDIDDTTSPLEAGLGWITKLNKTENFPSKDFLIKQKESGISKKLCGLKILDRAIPRHGYDIVNEQNEMIGVITSGTHAPTLDFPIALGYVASPYHKIGSKVYVSIRNKSIPAEVVKLPFIK